MLVPYIEGTKKKKEKKMSLINAGIIFEMFLLGVVILWISKQYLQQNRQPSLSKKIIKNLKI